ncbi:hypothetical protein F2Q69_00037533 [Brassica cretica]|uniref:Uncharacterized protein n=1 Tax=Brassica cretica TaxID=69181 RepID=A0A8S9SM58_BRACR|nr:hypothetical protein F2Q69_00037533 [Brassica cretica]
MEVVESSMALKKWQQRVTDIPAEDAAKIFDDKISVGKMVHLLPVILMIQIFGALLRSRLHYFLSYISSERLLLGSMATGIITRVDLRTRCKIRNYDTVAELVEKAAEQEAGISEEAKVFGTVAHVHPGCSDNSMKIQAKRNFQTAMVGSGQVMLDSDKAIELEERTREKSPIKREFSIFGWIDQVRVKNDRLWGESDCLNVRRSDRNRSRGVSRDRIKQNKLTLRQSRFLPSTHLDQIMRLEPHWPARA